jgi:beta-mannosidase
MHIDLNGTWQLRWTDGQRGDQLSRLLVEEPDLSRAILAQVPGEVHLDLVAAGLIEEPALGLNSLTCRWVEEAKWSYLRTFDAGPLEPGQRAWLVLDGLELHAAVYLNGELVGTHANAFYPCRIEVTGRVRPGANRLLVHVEAGLFASADRPGQGYGMNPDSTWTKRNWHRTVQSSFGWDWSPRLLNVGITGGARLEIAAGARLETLVALAEVTPDLAEGTLTARVFVEGLADEAQAARLHVTVEGPTGSHETEVDVTVLPGLHPVEARVRVPQPALWWPVNHGGQPLYTVRATLTVGDVTIGAMERRAGFRRIEVDQSPHPDGGRYFVITVNNKPIFCKGGNFVPADIIPARAGRDKYALLVDRALEANCNLLRIWGGGLYERDDVLRPLRRARRSRLAGVHLRLCQVPGLTTRRSWRMSSTRPHTRCAGWQTTRAWPSGAATTRWSGARTTGAMTRVWPIPTMPCSTWLCPSSSSRRTARATTSPARPSRPTTRSRTAMTWATSTRGASVLPTPTSASTGRWRAASRTRAASWAQRAADDVLACLPPGTTGDSPLDPTRAGARQTLAWEHHDNSVAYWGGARPHPDVMLEQWLGRSRHDMTVSKYVYWAGVVQGIGLSEYIRNFRRRMFSTASAIFWMYNDCWPTTRSWTIVDYYGRRTPAFYPVRRAFQPVSVAIGVEGDDVVFSVVNEGGPLRGELRCGFFALDGSSRMDDTTVPVNAGANEAQVIARRPLAELHALGAGSHAAYALLRQDGREVSRDVLFLPYFREMAGRRRRCVSVARAGRPSSRAMSLPGASAWTWTGRRRCRTTSSMCFPASRLCWIGPRSWASPACCAWGTA